MDYHFSNDPHTVLEYEEGGDELMAHLDVKSGYDKDNLGESVFRALLPSLTDSSTLRKWKILPISGPDQDLARRVLRRTIEKQADRVRDLLNLRPGRYDIFGNWHLLPRRGYQRLELWI